MKLKITFLFLFLLCFNLTFGTDLDSAIIFLRNNFYIATESEKVNLKLESFILYNFGDNIDNYHPKILAYYGIVQSLKAKFTYNPYLKYKYVVKGIDYLRKAVERNPTSVEIRFLRFAVLHNIPALFGFKDLRNEDLNFIFNYLLSKNFSELDYYWQTNIARFLIESNRLNDNARSKLFKIFPSLASK